MEPDRKTRLRKASKSAELDASYYAKAYAADVKILLDEVERLEIELAQVKIDLEDSEIDKKALDAAYYEARDRAERLKKQLETGHAPDPDIGRYVSMEIEFVDKPFPTVPPKPLPPRPSTPSTPVARMTSSKPPHRGPLGRKR